LIRERESGRLLGPHLPGEGADELINFFALAMRLELAPDVFREILWAYPTHTSDLPCMV